MYAQLTFDVGADGKATQVTFHQNGNNQTAVRKNESDSKRVLAGIRRESCMRGFPRTVDSAAVPPILDQPAPPTGEVYTGDKDFRQPTSRARFTQAVKTTHL